MAQEIDPFKLSSPRIFLVRMVVFLTLCALVVVVLYKQIWTAFLANPVVNALIIGVLIIGIALAFQQVIRLFPEIDWVNGFRLADPGLAVERPPVLLAPMAALLRDRIGRMAISAQVMRGILDSIAARLDEARDTSRYMTGLLVFLGLLGTFWGLIETMGSVGSVINSLKPAGDAGVIFESLKEGLAAPLGGIGIAFSASLFGLAGSLVLGFLDLQMSPGAEPLLHRARGLALHHRARSRRGQRCRGGPAGSGRGVGRPESGDRAAAGGDHRGRIESGNHHRHGQSRGSDSGAGPSHAQRAADDPRLGRFAGPAASRGAPPARTARARKRQQVGTKQNFK